ncbi:MAG TPA: HD domain-containing phosphohydrolase [Bryobacteraceae bacterium]|nr:HD domain-containing phosphohydrolase [Bryobacteraceae bacterium]
MDEKILCVDDELNILLALQRQLRKQFHLESALGAEKALATISRDGPFAAIVSDLQMPGMNGLEFLAKAKEMSPDSVRIMLTGQADLATAIAAVNQGNIFRFLTKPCSAEELAHTLAAAVEQYRLITAERHLLEDTLSGSVKVLTEILSLVHPAAFSRATRIRRYVRHMAQELKLASAWQFDVAAMLSQIGCITMPPDTLDRIYTGEELSDEERKMFEAHPAAGRDLVVNIPRLEPVGQMIAGQNRTHAQQAAETHASEAVTLGQGMLRAAIDFDRLIARGRLADDALAQMRKRKEDYHPRCLEALGRFVAPEAGMEVQILKTGELRPAMVVDQDVRTKDGLLLLAKGQEVTPSVLSRLRAFARRVGIAEPVRVLVPKLADMLTES